MLLFFLCRLSVLLLRDVVFNIDVDVSERSFEGAFVLLLCVFVFTALTSVLPIMLLLFLCQLSVLLLRDVVLNIGVYVFERSFEAALILAFFAFMAFMTCNCRDRFIAAKESTNNKSQCALTCGLRSQHNSSTPDLKTSSSRYRFTDQLNL